jgi:hypothetical protein
MTRSRVDQSLGANRYPNCSGQTLVRRPCSSNCLSFGRWSFSSENCRRDILAQCPLVSVLAYCPGTQWYRSVIPYERSIYRIALEEFCQPALGSVLFGQPTVQGNPLAISSIELSRHNLCRIFYPVPESSPFPGGAIHPTSPGRCATARPDVGRSG